METHPKSSAFLFQLWSQGYDSEALLRHRIKSSFCDSFKNNQLPGPHKVSFFCYLYIQINTQFLSDFCLINGKWGLYPVYVLRLLWKFPIWEFFKLIKTHSLFSSSFLFPLLREELSLTFVKNILGYPTLIPFLALSVILSSVLLKCLAFMFLHFVTVIWAAFCSLSQTRFHQPVVHQPILHLACSLSESCWLLIFLL